LLNIEWQPPFLQTADWATGRQKPGAGLALLVADIRSEATRRRTVMGD
jgi:hypothetical protein